MAFAVSDATALAWTGRLITWWLLAWSWRRLSFAVLPRPGWSILTAAIVRHAYG